MANVNDIRLDKTTSNITAGTTNVSDTKAQKGFQWLFDNQGELSDDTAKQSDDILDAEEIRTLLKKAGVDMEKLDDEATQTRFENWLKGYMGTANYQAGMGKEMLKIMKEVLKDEELTVPDGTNSDTDVESKDDSAKTNTTTTTTKLVPQDMPGLIHDGDEDYIEIQDWGSDALDGNKSANDCLSRIAKNYYPDMPADEAMKMIMEANPEIYDSDRSIMKGATGKENTLIFTGEKLVLPNLRKEETVTTTVSAEDSAENGLVDANDTGEPDALSTIDATDNESGAVGETAPANIPETRTANIPETRTANIPETRTANIGGRGRGGAQGTGGSSPYSRDLADAQKNGKVYLDSNFKDEETLGKWIVNNTGAVRIEEDHNGKPKVVYLDKDNKVLFWSPL